MQTRLANAQLQKSSGLKSSTYAELGSADVSRLVTVEDTLSRTKAWSANTQTVLDRVEVMHSTLGSIGDKMTSLKKTLSAAVSNTGSVLDYPELGRGMLNDLKNLMNTQVDGRYLFSGGRTDTAPVDISKLTLPPTGVDLNYYQGDSSLASVQVSSDLTLTYGVTANNSGFEKALRAAAMLTDLTAVPIDSDKVKAAYTLASEAFNDLVNIRGNVSVSSSRLEEIKNSQDDAVTLLASRASDLKSVDIADIAVQVSQLQTSLEASFSALAKISSLSLAKYL
ncbi:Flagellin and hook associated protein [Magnetospirillum molischianum DSM 120]|uniref:Flagellin and hook associated protein n=1 Tax=Magnetospirillum molischianum DSM 120 TaxID=1150626 RepID=H8FWC7_MAGML|nr:Flagellin and hook associated protein [Magnetospirillum molischianum DSM 120]